MSKTGNCPCGSGEDYKNCCRPYHKGHKLPKTAEILMRSRYCAYVKERTDYILDTWHPTTRPATIEPDNAVKWRGLEIMETENGMDTDSTGIVTFCARYIANGAPGSMKETSQFIKDLDRWFYVKAQ